MSSTSWLMSPASVTANTVIVLASSPFRAVREAKPITGMFAPMGMYRALDPDEGSHDAVSSGTAKIEDALSL